MKFNLDYVEFRRDQISQVSTDPGIYQIIALPFSETTQECDINMLKKYVDSFQNAYLQSWEGQIDTPILFKDRSFAIDLTNHMTIDIDKTEIYLDQTSKKDLHSFFLQFLNFLPSLYIGIAGNLQTRFRDHTNYNDVKSTIYKLTNDRDYLSFKNCKKYFIWKSIKANTGGKIDLRDDLLEEMERVMIQTKKPLINKVKRK